MKRAEALCLAILLVAILPLLWALPLEEPLHKPVHVDPSSIEYSTPLPVPVNLVLIDLLEKLKNGDYNGTITLARILAAAENVYKNQIRRLSSLAVEASNYLGGTEKEIAAARHYLELGDRFSAKRSLISAKKNLELANDTLTELQEAIMVLSSRMHLSPTFFQKGFSSLYEKLDALDSDLKTLALEILYFNKTRTIISLNVYPAKPRYGDTVNVWGRLYTADGLRLPYRRIKVFFYNQVYETSTDYRGYYSVQIEARPPVEKVRLTVLYNSTGWEGYTSAINTTTLIVTFTVTRVAVAVPEEAYPGDTVWVNVSVTPTRTARLVHIFLDGARVYVANTTGALNATIRIPPEIREGEHLVTVYVVGKPGYKPAFGRRIIHIVREPVDFRLTYTWPLAIYPLAPFIIAARAHTLHGEPLGGRVVATLRGEKLYAEAADGVFQVSGLYTTPLVDYVEAKVVFVPEDPRYREVEYTVGIYAVNIISVLLLSAVAWTVNRLRVLQRLLFRARDRRVREGVVSIARRTYARIGSFIEARIAIKRRAARLLAYRGRVGPAVWALVNLLTLIYRKISIPIRKTETFREYLMRISGKVGVAAFRALLNLTKYAEMERYGNKKVPSKSVKKFEEEVLKHVEE